VEFVETVRANLGVYGRQRDLEVVRDEQRGVQLMTIHKSKGLEFPVVVLANTGNMGRNTGIGTQPFYLSSRFGLTASMPAASSPLSEGRRVNYFFDEGERENREMELAELKRLLYVALTRAESHLLVTGVFNAQNQQQDRHLLNQLLTALGIMPDNPAAGATQVSVPVDIDIIPNVPRSRTYGAPGSRPSISPETLHDRYRRAERVERKPLPDEISVTELADRFHAGGAEAVASAELPAVESDSLLEERGLAGFFGTLTHYLIESALKRGRADEAAGAAGAAGAPESARADGRPVVPLLAELPPAVRREAQRQEVTADEYRRIAADAAGLAAGFLSSGLAASIAGAELESEVPFVLHRRVGSRPAWIHGQIDLVALGTSEGAAPDARAGADAQRAAVKVIDFKTDRNYRPRAHELQLAIYREAAAKLYGVQSASGEPGGTDVVAMVYYLRSGAFEEAGPMPELSEELLTARTDQASKTT
jgi:ATP-dependent exoDNAse (exonuclease V) beta subunit